MISFYPADAVRFIFMLSSPNGGFARGDLSYGGDI
jgi:hypothetical protein